MIEEEEFNFLYYNEDCLFDGDKMFKNYFEYMNEIKNNTDDKDIRRVCKIMCSSMWGHLTEGNKVSYIYNINQLKKDEKIININPLTNEVTKIKSGLFYKGILPRIKPFLVCCARNNIMNYIEKYKLECILVRSHTDCLQLNYIPKKLEHILNEKYDKKKIGNFKYEKLENIYITNLNSPFKFFKKINENTYEEVEEV